MELSHRQPVLLDEVVLRIHGFSKFFIVMFLFGTYFIKFVGNVIMRFIPKSVMGIFKPWPLSIMCK